MKPKSLALVAFVAAQVGTCAGCVSGRSAHRLTSPDRDPTLLELAEQPIEDAQQALDNLDRFIENTAY
ncbi:MAG: hypothetical protein HZB38_08810 [Planctomycetes bacterium]|nr:hypothetical protein [Planctomycetota bacterium]